MTDTPNIKRDLLEHVLETTEPNDTVDKNTVCDLRDFAEEHGYEENRVANKVFEINVASDDKPVFDWGVSPMYVWYYDRDNLRAALQRVTP